MRSRKTPTASEPQVVRSIGSFDFDYIGSTSGGMIQLAQALYYDFKQGRIKGSNTRGEIGRGCRSWKEGGCRQVQEGTRLLEGNTGGSVSVEFSLMHVLSVVPDETVGTLGLGVLVSNVVTAASCR